MSEPVIAITAAPNEQAAEIKSQIRALKGELKAWEYKFNDEHGRKPQKEDILQDKAIAKKYKQYSKLKARQNEENGGHGDIEMSASTDALLVTMGRDKTEEALSSVPPPMPPLDTYADLKINNTNNSDAKARASLALATNTDSATKVLELAAQSPQSATSPQLADANAAVSGSEDSLDQPTVAPEILAHPTVVFRSTHPLLKHLSSKELMGAKANNSGATSPKAVDGGAALSKIDETAPADSAAPLPVAAANAVLATLKSSAMSSDLDLFARIPKGQVLRCQLVRKSDGVDRAFPSYFLINEANDKFMLAGRKRKKTKLPHYVISTNADDLSKQSNGYVAKVKATDSTSTKFVTCDTRVFPGTAASAESKELLGIYYARGTAPREIKVAVRSDEPTTTPAPTLNILNEMETNKASVLQLKNKLPTFNQQTKTYAMNFGGRVKLPSVKNFQLCLASDPNSLIFQFGRVTEDSFALDAFYPLTPVEAFSIALSAFDALGHV